MGRTSTTITFSLPPEMAARVQELMKEEGRTKSELLREAIRRYIEEREWRLLLKYGERRARERGLAPEDVERLVDEYRSETAQSESRS
ncbi:MAG: ribbon-helix-helix protein, CopG family [Chloroflexi bacterium]|nr:ribbon-helix-helix protein, CopG family [Chloroflexota bacterium]